QHGYAGLEPDGVGHPVDATGAAGLAFDQAEIGHGRRETRVRSEDASVERLGLDEPASLLQPHRLAHGIRRHGGAAAHRAAAAALSPKIAVPTRTCVAPRLTAVS